MAMTGGEVVWCAIQPYQPEPKSSGLGSRHIVKERCGKGRSAWAFMRDSWHAVTPLCNILLLLQQLRDFLYITSAGCSFHAELYSPIALTIRSLACRLLNI